MFHSPASKNIMSIVSIVSPTQSPAQAGLSWKGKRSHRFLFSYQRKAQRSGFALERKTNTIGRSDRAPRGQMTLWYSSDEGV